MLTAGEQASNGEAFEESAPVAPPPSESSTDIFEPSSEHLSPSELVTENSSTPPVGEEISDGQSSGESASNTSAPKRSLADALEPISELPAPAELVTRNLATPAVEERIPDGQSSRESTSVTAALGGLSIEISEVTLEFLAANAQAPIPNVPVPDELATEKPDGVEAVLGELTSEPDIIEAVPDESDTEPEVVEAIPDDEDSINEVLRPEADSFAPGRLEVVYPQHDNAGSNGPWKINGTRYDMLKRSLGL
jgi:hypothetical protein